MDNPAPRDTAKKLPLAVAGLVVIVTILCRTGSTILTPIWIDSLNQDKTKNSSNCNIYTSERHVDPFAMLLIVNVLFTLLFGVIYICTKIFCSSIITERETGYDKKEFAAVGFTETLAAMFLLLSSSGCRTAPYLQVLAANFTIPVTFFLRFLILRKRPTCRKLLCAMLVLVAMFTALMPEVFPDLDSAKAKKEEGGAEGVAGLLWAICNFFGFVPLSICTIIIEKVMKARARGDRARGGDSSQLNTAYVMFWCYFFALLSQLLLFWMDVIPGFGMTDNMEDFAKVLWFNMKCFLGYAGCSGLVNYVSGPCVAVVISNRLIQAYFVRYLEGANLMAMILLIPTPLAFIFYTLFDEDPLRWHPHAYLSTWLSIVALCIMIPAIYIYSSGAPEVDYNRPEGNGDDDERRPLLGNGQDFPDQGVERYGYTRTSSVATQAGSMVDGGVQTSLPDPSSPSQGFQTYTTDLGPTSQGFQTFKPGQPRQRTNPFVRDHRVMSDVSVPHWEVQNKYSSEADNGSYGCLDTSMPVARKVVKQPDTEVSSSWPAPEYSFQGRKDRDEEQKPSTRDSGTQDRFGTRDIPLRNPVHDEQFDDRHDPVWTSSDFNVNGVDNQGDFRYEDRLNPFGTSPYVEVGAGDQNVVKYIDPQEPAVQEGEESGMRASDAGQQLIASGSPPSYTSLPKE